MPNQNETIIVLLLVFIVFTIFLIVMRCLYKNLPKTKLVIESINFSDVNYNGRNNNVCTVVFDSDHQQSPLVLGSYLTKKLMIKKQAGNNVFPNTVNYHYIPGLRKFCGYYDFDCFLLPLKFYFVTLLWLAGILILFAFHE